MKNLATIAIMISLCWTATFSSEKIFENADELVKTIVKLKPSTTKGTYIKSIFMSSTMSPSVQIEAKFS